MDRTARLRVVRMGIGLQALGVTLALLVFAPVALDLTSATWLLPLLLPLITLCGCCEALGALVSSVAVRKDWLPAVYVSTAEGGKLADDLAALNTQVTHRPMCTL